MALPFGHSPEPGGIIPNMIGSEANFEEFSKC